MPSVSLSSAPCTVTVWSPFQLVVVKLRLSLPTIAPSEASLLATRMFTFPEGLDLSRTEKSACSLVSLVVPDMGATTISAVRSSTLTKPKSVASLPEYCTSVETAAPSTILKAWSPSEVWSFSPRT